jgi:hypothetical protein
MSRLHRSLAVPLFAASLACAVACAPAAPPPESAPDAGGDPAEQAKTCPDNYPTADDSPGYGASKGKNLEPFTLPQCDGTPYSFLNADFCASTFTVISVAAGWCAPCQAESAVMTDRLTNAYKDRGVRVIQILLQDPQYREPDQAFCEQWVAEYGLTNVELMDKDGQIAPLFPSGSLPSTLIVDSKGRIVHREDGFSEGLNTIRAKLDQLLAQ